MHFYLKASQTLQHIGNYLPFPVQLFAVLYMLKLTSAANAVMRTGSFQAIYRGTVQSTWQGAGIVFL
jgi:hypothetical protein